MQTLIDGCLEPKVQLGQGMVALLHCATPLYHVGFHVENWVCSICFFHHCTEVRNGRFSSGGGILSQLQWYQSDIQKLGFPKYEIKDN